MAIVKATSADIDLLARLLRAEAEAGSRRGNGMLMAVMSTSTG